MVSIRAGSHESRRHGHDVEIDIDVQFQSAPAPMRAGDELALPTLTRSMEVSIRAGSHESRRHKAAEHAFDSLVVSIRAGSHESRRLRQGPIRTGSGQFQSAPAPMRAGDSSRAQRDRRSVVSIRAGSHESRRRGASVGRHRCAGFNPRRLP